MVSFQLVSKILAIPVITILIAGATHAESQLDGFFTQDSARSPFLGTVNVTAQQELVHLRPMQEIKETPEEPEAKQADIEEKTEQPVDRHHAQPKTAEEIIKTFGDPAAPYPVAATEDAPGPFKAMYAAMNAGDDELAFKYAVQYVKFRDQLKEQNKKAVSIMGHAQRKAGILPAGSWPDADSHAEYAYLQDIPVPGVDDVAETAAKEQINVTAETQQLIAKLKEAQFDLFNDEKQKIKKDLQSFEIQEREATRKELGSTLPVAATGEIDILVFLKLSQDESLELAPEIQKLHAVIQKSKKVNLAAFSMGALSPSAIKSFQFTTKTQFPLLPGTEVAKSMGLKATPAVIFVTREGKSHLEVGFQNFFRLDEIRKIMQGEKL